ncbi:hypothetical protein FF011L_04140 [Roseimaritima multifibrata]|uniref:Peptidase C39 domain-containing protein n=1 Tax=Roseimaritima multifibrata TaxID=1930274 RepID=A0A517M9X1_9BACT|nr:hypothetical protein FF011L_04140 [Roseimaritima multifibrata]
MGILPKLTIVFIALASSSVSRCTAGEPSVSTVEQRKLPLAPRSYCGIYAVWQGLKVLNKDVAFQDLVDAKYVGSPEGSTAAELVAAVERYDVRGIVQARMSNEMLESSQHPIVLHVRSSLVSESYDHWMLFVGVADGKAMICNGLEAEKPMSFARLSSIWDGTGIVLSDTGCWGDLGVSTACKDQCNRFAPRHSDCSLDSRTCSTRTAVRSAATAFGGGFCTFVVCYQFGLWR